MVAARRRGRPTMRGHSRGQPTRIDARRARALAAEGAMGDYSRSHLMEARARSKRTLEASREADAARGMGTGGLAAPQQAQP